jgi:predicted N-acetyltransferase YhbS
MQFAYLVDHPEFFPLVAQWNWDEWHSLLSERSPAEFEGWLRANVQRNAIPTTLLALDGRIPVGTVSVVEFDLDSVNDRSPWLASLFVLPSRRGRGLGQALVHAAVAEAARLGFGVLHLYTPGQEAFYSALGWERVESLKYRGQPITIMRRSL